MSGGITQLVAVGIQDAYLTSNPEVSFFRSSYKRYTHFAQNVERQVIQGNPNVNGVSLIRFEKKGDLLSDVYLTARDPNNTSNVNTNWSQIISKLELMIGGQIIDTQDMTYTSNIEPVVNARTYSQKFSALDAVNSVFLPLKFFFCKDWQSAIPLIALQYHDVEIRITWATPNPWDQYVAWARFLYLDTEEREWFAKNKHDMLITQVTRVPITPVSNFEFSLAQPIKYIAFDAVNYDNVYNPITAPTFTNSLGATSATVTVLSDAGIYPGLSASITNILSNGYVSNVSVSNSAPILNLTYPTQTVPSSLPTGTPINIAPITLSSSSLSVTPTGLAINAGLTRISFAAVAVAPTASMTSVVVSSGFSCTITLTFASFAAKTVSLTNNVVTVTFTSTINAPYAAGTSIAVAGLNAGIPDATYAVSTCTNTTITFACTATDISSTTAAGTIAGTSSPLYFPGTYTIGASTATTSVDIPLGVAGVSYSSITFGTVTIPQNATTNILHLTFVGNLTTSPYNITTSTLATVSSSGLSSAQLGKGVISSITNITVNGVVCTSLIITCNTLASTGTTPKTFFVTFIPPAADTFFFISGTVTPTLGTAFQLTVTSSPTIDGNMVGTYILFPQVAGYPLTAVVNWVSTDDATATNTVINMTPIGAAGSTYSAITTSALITTSSVVFAYSPIAIINNLSPQITQNNIGSATAATLQFKMQINGNDIGESRSLPHWSFINQYYLTPYGYDNSNNTVAIIPFCLDTAKTQPTGSINFSRIDTFRLICPSSTNFVNISRLGTGSYFYAVNYNILRIQNGMGAVMYSS